MTPVPTAQLQNKQRSPESPLLTYSFPVQPWFRFFAQLSKSHLSRGRPETAAKIMDGAASSGRPSIHPGCPRQVLSTRGVGPRAFRHSPHPSGNNWKGLTDLASESHNTTLCADRYHLCLHKSHFPEQQWETFATSEMVRATVKADTEGLGRQFKGPSQRTPEICHSQSELGGGHRQYQHQTHRVPSGQKAETVLCRRCSEPHVCRDQAGDSGTLAVRGGNCLSPPPTFRILLVASNRNYNSNLLKPNKGRGGRAEGKEGGRSGSFNWKVQNLGQIWDTNDIIIWFSLALLPTRFLFPPGGLHTRRPLSFAQKIIRRLLYSFQPLEKSNVFFSNMLKGLETPCLESPTCTCSSTHTKWMQRGFSNEKRTSTPEGKVDSRKAKIIAQTSVRSLQFDNELTWQV